MAGLVADYSSSEDEIASHNTDKNEIEQDSVPAHQSKNFLISQNESDSDEDEVEDQQQNQNAEDRLPNPLEAKLPAAQSAFEKVASVFSNPFERAEMAKNSVLEQHVRMTEKAPERGNKQVCWKFKKGQCHMGKNCRFFHSQDNVVGNVTESAPVNEMGEEYFVFGRNERTFRGSNNSVSPSSNLSQEIDEDDYMAGKKRKKVGMGQHLVPPKRAMSALEEQRAKERPWTIKKNS